ncbi:MAG: T9SS type A sorting domain-containing protein, partial [Prevotellaceae bacterium]|nr:T9SS type A sorting domain-containing protein [Prevotellaceae bacterium]
ATLSVYVGEWGARSHELLIYNAAGSLVLRQRFSGAFVTLPFAAPAGIYFLRVGSKYGKIVVE